MRPTSVIYQTSRATRQVLFRRYQSTDSAVAKAQQQSSAATAKAQEGLKSLNQKVGPVLQGLVGSLGRIGGRTGRLVKQIEGLIPPTIYYSKVVAELSKIVWHTRKMAPPPISTFEQYYKGILTKARAGHVKFPSIQTVKDKAQDKEALSAAAVVGAELIGFFTIGEIIGRRKIVGYRGKVHHAHH